MAKTCHSTAGDLMRFSLPITVAALALLVAACSSTSPSATSPPSAKMTSSAPANPNAGLPTGTQLKALLAPASWFPRGFKIDPAKFRPHREQLPVDCAARRAEVQKAACHRLGSAGQRWGRVIRPERLF